MTEVMRGTTAHFDRTCRVEACTRPARAAPGGWAWSSGVPMCEVCRFRERSLGSPLAKPLPMNAYRPIAKQIARMVTPEQEAGLREIYGQLLYRLQEIDPQSDDTLHQLGCRNVHQHQAYQDLLWVFEVANPVEIGVTVATMYVFAADPVNAHYFAKSDRAFRFSVVRAVQRLHRRRAHRSWWDEKKGEVKQIVRASSSMKVTERKATLLIEAYKPFVTGIFEMIRREKARERIKRDSLLPPPLSPREHAKLDGLKFYRGGRPCRKHPTGTIRLTSNATCYECHRDRVRQTYHRRRNQKEQQQQT